MDVQMLPSLDELFGDCAVPLLSPPGSRSPAATAAATPETTISADFDFDFDFDLAMITDAAAAEAALLPGPSPPASPSPPYRRRPESAEALRSWELLVSRDHLALEDNKAWGRVLRAAKPLLSKAELREVQHERRRARDRNHAAAGRAARKAAQQAHADVAPQLRLDIAGLQAANVALRRELAAARTGLSAGAATLADRRRRPALSFASPAAGVAEPGIAMLPEDLTEESYDRDDVDRWFEEATAALA